MSQTNGVVMRDGKVSKAAVMRQAIAEVGLSADGKPDYDKILAVARRKMATYPKEQQSELTRLNAHAAFSELKASGQNKAPVAPASRACAVMAEVMAPPDTYTADEIRAASACLRHFDNDIARLTKLLTILGDR